MYCYAPSKEYLYRRIIIVGILWSLLFLGSLRSSMIDVWNFDIIDYRDWVYIWKLWINGWVVDEPDELLFLGLVVFFLPLWITGWTAISSIKWEKLYYDFVFKHHRKTKEKEVRAKLSKMEKEGFEEKEFDPTSLLTIERPRPIGGQIALDILPDPPLPYDVKERKRQEKAEKKAIKAATKQAQKEAKEIEEETAEDNSVSAEKSDEIMKISSVKEILTTVGYKLIENVDFTDCHIDYVAISKSSALLCLVDKDKGDWLADEESFGGEEPLWFSESKHRGSPIFKIKRAREALVHKLTGVGVEVTAVAIIKEGVIINGQDMMNNWLDMNVMVCRIGDGGPDELPSFPLVMKGNKAEPAVAENVEKIKTAIEELASGNNEMLLSEEHDKQGEKPEKPAETKKSTNSKISLSKKPKTEAKVEETKEEDSLEARLAALAEEFEAEEPKKESKEEKKEAKEEKASTDDKISEEKPATKKKVVKRVVKKPVNISDDASGSKKKVVKKVVRRKKVAKPTSLTDNKQKANDKEEKVETAKITTEKKSEQPKRKNKISLKKS